MWASTVASWQTVSNLASGAVGELMCSFCGGITNGVVRGVQQRRRSKVSSTRRDMMGPGGLGSVDKDRRSKQLGTGELRVLVTFVLNLVYLMVCLYI